MTPSGATAFTTPKFAFLKTSTSQLHNSAKLHPFSSLEYWIVETNPTDIGLKDSFLNFSQNFLLFRGSGLINHENHGAPVRQWFGDINLYRRPLSVYWWLFHAFFLSRNLQRWIFLTLLFAKELAEKLDTIRESYWVEFYVKFMS